jgi:hypothetical protein
MFAAVRLDNLDSATSAKQSDVDTIATANDEPAVRFPPRPWAWTENRRAFGQYETVLTSPTSD